MNKLEDTFKSELKKIKKTIGIPYKRSSYREGDPVPSGEAVFLDDCQRLLSVLEDQPDMIGETIPLYAKIPLPFKRHNIDNPSVEILAIDKNGVDFDDNKFGFLFGHSVVAVVDGEKIIALNKDTKQLISFEIAREYSYSTHVNVYSSKNLMKNDWPTQEKLKNNDIVLSIALYTPPKENEQWIHEPDREEKRVEWPQIAKNKYVNQVYDFAKAYSEQHAKTQESVQSQPNE